MSAQSRPPVDAGRTRAVRLFGAGAAIVAAGLYLLIGVGVLPVGAAASGGAPDLFAFGAIMSGIFAATAILLARFAARPLWIGVAILQLIVIVGYFAMASLRVPAVELNGLLVKTAQVAVLVAVGWLLLAGAPSTTQTVIRTRR